MSKIYRNVVVPIPEGARITKQDGRVSIVTEKHYLPDKQYNVDDRKVVGLAISESEMYPNSFFRWKFPEIYAQYSKEELPEHTKSIGLYTASLAIGQGTGLYQSLIDSYGIETSNAIMDFSCFSILSNSNVAMLYHDTMRQQLLYSESLRNDSWFSSFFKDQINSNQTEEFQKAWAGKCMDAGCKSVWISIDGSNCENHATKCELAEKGHSKTKNNSDIISYMYAVDAVNATPIAYRVYRGSRVDTRELNEIITFLVSYDIDIEGVILDRGFCDADSIKVLKSFGLKYILMMKQNTLAYETMSLRYGNDIKSKWKYSLDAYGIYGITEKTKLFSKSPEEAYVSLFYDSSNGTARTATFVSKLKKEIRTLSNIMQSGDRPSIPKEYASYISLKKDEGGKYMLSTDGEAIQKVMDAKGLSAIACSENMSADDINHLYHLRDASEKQFMILKSQLGNDVMRAHYTSGIESRFAVAFVAAIIRNYMMNAAMAAEIATNAVIRELNFLQMHLLHDDAYAYVHTENKKQIRFLAEIGVALQDLDYVADEENKRLSNAIHTPFHSLPEHNGVTQQGTVRKRPGRPKGSKNLKGTTTKPESVIKRGPGRPKGSKNKPKPEQPRKPGRPKGSKNKPKTL